MLNAFDFAHRQFAQAVNMSEVIAYIQGVEGVIATDLDQLYLQGKARLLASTLAAESARWDKRSGQFLPAQLLLLNPKGIILTSVLSL